MRRIENGANAGEPPLREDAEIQEVLGIPITPTVGMMGGPTGLPSVAFVPPIVAGVGLDDEDPAPDDDDPDEIHGPDIDYQDLQDFVEDATEMPQSSA